MESKGLSHYYWLNWLKLGGIALACGTSGALFGLTPPKPFQQQTLTLFQALPEVWKTGHLSAVVASIFAIALLAIALAIRLFPSAKDDLQPQTHPKLFGDRQGDIPFQLLAETATCAFLVYQGNHLRYVNPAAEQITGYSREQLLTMNFWELAHPDYQDLIRDRGLACQRGEAVPRSYEFKIITQAGQERWIEIIGGSVELDGQPAALATAYDITEHKEAEERLQMAASRDRLLSEIALRIRSSLSLEEILNTTVAEVRHFLRADRVFIAHLEPGGGCKAIAESADPQWKSTLGWIMGDDQAAAEVRDLFEPGTVSVVNDADTIEKTPFLEKYYKRCQVKACLGTPIMLDGDLFGVLAVNQCSTPREWQPFEIALLQQLGTQVEIAIQQGKLYQQLKALATNLECQVEERTVELNQRMEELQDLNQVKDLLLHAVSHDLRTPVQGTLMLLNHLCNRDCEPDNDSVLVPQTILRRMIESSDRQLGLLNCLIDNHIGTQSSHSLLNREQLTLQSLVDVAIAKLAPKFCQNNAVLLNQIPSDIPSFYGDSAKLHYVLENLLSNAVRHNSPGRTITLTASVVEAARDQEHRPGLYSGRSPSSRFICCTVEDDGEGIIQEQCDRLFQLYVRGVDNHHLTGIGLGLHRCQQIIIAHNGQIGVDSCPGNGSKFWFTLPIDSY
jgi:PAS domain S-box-containing protein